MLSEYKEIFYREIIERSKGIIISYSALEDKFAYKPYSHSVSDDAVEKLGALMRKNLLFYSYGEEEIVKYYNRNSFDSLEQASKYAYSNRLPKRPIKQDGLPSEVLLDLLIQIYNPNAAKLSVRTILRQNDNNEIKGYDLTYFTKDESGISLWLGQAKLGTKTYCKTDIHKDLSAKYGENYMSKQLFFLSDKRTRITKEAEEILDIIEEINILSIECDESERTEQLMRCFSENNIHIKIPCLLAYDSSDVYEKPEKLEEMIMCEASDIKEYFSKHTYEFGKFSPEIVFYVFPIEVVERLRDKETGFYAGLC